MKRVILLFSICVIAISAPLNINACGPYFPDVFFVYTLHPDFPLDRFAAGRLGILQSTYARSYLYVAYRYMMGTGFDSAEQAELARLWEDRLHGWGLSGGVDTKAWIEARASVPGIAASESRVDSYKYIEWQYIVNCNSDAFVVAADTLHSLIEKYGAENVNVKDWVLAQDQVFANCGGESPIVPTAAPAAAPAVFRSHRNYQVAAARFYAGDFAESRRLFLEISRDSASPWKSFGTYLAIRSLIRQAQLANGIDAPADKAQLAQAGDELEQLRKELQNDPDSGLLESVRRLEGYIKFRRDAAGRAAELAPLLMQPDSSSMLYQNLWDYTASLDRFDAGTPRKDDLTEWIFAFQATAPGSLQTAWKKWKETSSLPWLIAALSIVAPSEAAAPELMAAAARVDSESPAYPTAAYHRIRLLIGTGRTADARSELDALLKKDWTPAERNQYLALRMQISADLHELVTFAQRVPAAVGYDWYNVEMPEAEGEEAQGPDGPLFPTDAAYVLNTQLPLDVLREAAKDPGLDSTLRRRLVKSIWTRAVLLDRMDVVRDMAGEVRSIVPATEEMWNAVTEAQDPDSAKFGAVFLLLWHPGMEPDIDSGLDRQAADNQVDSFRDNWWCAGREAKPGEAPAFLTSEQKNALEKESRILALRPPAPNELTARVLARAQAHPDDPRVPEALYLAVRSTRYGCTDKSTSRYSREAFQYLHKHYPSSEWTAKTPYYY